MTHRGAEVQALVLSGGGAFAAYEVGIAKALLRGESPATGFRPLDPAVLSGTSAGSFNAALLAGCSEIAPEAAAAELERAWLEAIADRPDSCDDGGVFRWRGTPFNLFDVECLASNPVQFATDRLHDAAFFAQDFLQRAGMFARSEGPLDTRLLELIDFSSLLSTSPFPRTLRRVLRLESIRRSRRRLLITATNFDTGALEIFANQDMTDEIGDLVVMASSATPGIFPPVVIPPSTYVDGGVLMNTPLQPAIRAGADLLHVVYLDPDILHIPLSDLRTTMGTLQRVMAIATAENFNHDTEQARRVNQGLEALEQAAPGLRPLIEAASQTVRQKDRAEPYRQLTIHRYHPHVLLGGPLGFLDFRRDTLKRLIEDGYRDAIAHDCAASKCVLPSSSPGA
ncbi:MAG TPA: patatin-like phospholipase family protein [Thermoanaerobaculia bacterium]